MPEAHRGRTGLVRVLIADDDEAFRVLAERLLVSAVVLAGETADAESALRVARDLAPDVVLMDIEIPSVGWIAANRLIQAAIPRRAC